MLNLLKKAWTSTDTVTVALLGPGAVGKTTFLTAALKGVGDFAPNSGLRLRSPLRPTTSTLWNGSPTGRSHSRTAGRADRPPSCGASWPPVVGRGYARLLLDDTVGQSLTEIGRSATSEQKRDYDTLNTLTAQADVLLVVVPCPDPTDAGADEFRNLMRVCDAHLTRCLGRRSARKPTTVGLVFSQADAVFGSREEARAALDGSDLLRVLGPLTSTLRYSEEVAEAAVMVVSAMGYGRTAGGKATPSPARAGRPRLESSRRDVLTTHAMNPDNLIETMLWVLLAGLLHRPEMASDPDKVRFLTDLRNDFQARDPWVVPIKGHITPAAG